MSDLYSLLDEAKIGIVINMLEHCDWNQSEAARRLCVSRETLSNILKSHNIKQSDELEQIERAESAALKTLQWHENGIAEIKKLLLELQYKKDKIKRDHGESLKSANA